MDAVELKPDHFTPEKTSLAILTKLEEAGFNNPVLIGGALRDDYLRQVVGIDVETNDYDVGAAISPKEIFGDIQDSAEATAKLSAYLQEKFPGAAIMECNVTLKDGAPYHGSASFKDATGHEIQLHLVSAEEAKLSLEQILSLNGTAPISSIVMDKNGRVIADAKFTEHASQCIYQPYQSSPKADERGEKLARKISGLTIMPPEPQEHMETAEMSEGQTGQQWSQMPRNRQGQRPNRKR